MIVALILAGCGPGEDPNPRPPEGTATTGETPPTVPPVVDTAPPTTPTGDTGPATCEADVETRDENGGVSGRRHLVFDPLFPERVLDDLITVGSGPTRTTSTWDPILGVLIEQRTDDGDDGTFEFSIWWTFDGSGYLVGYRQESIGTPFLDFSDTYVNDAAGNLIRVETDLEGDGVVDYVATLTYDAADRLTRIDSATGAGDPNYRWDYHYDEPTGSSHTSFLDQPIGAPIDILYRELYSVPDDYLLEQEMVVDGEPHTLDTYTRDADGRVLTSRSVRISPAFVTVDDETWTYDVEGRPLTRDELRTYDAVTEEEHETWTYDVDGRTLTRDEVRNDDGVIEADHDVWTWSCP